jgi:hypothetical protein
MDLFGAVDGQISVMANPSFRSSVHRQALVRALQNERSVTEGWADHVVQPPSGAPGDEGKVEVLWREENVVQFRPRNA